MCLDCRFLISILLFLLSCKSATHLPQDHSLIASSGGSPKVCAAIRGNGDRILAHYGALARYHEYYPMFEGIAGGSSGSVTSFIYESLHLNPVLGECGDKECDAEQSRLRLSFLLKSMMGYAQVYRDSEEIQAFLYTMDAVSSLRKIFAEKDFSQLLKAKPFEALKRIELVLTSSELKLLLNPDLLPLLRSSKNLRFHLAELQRAVSTFGSYEAETENIFFFPGFMNWREFARRIGRIADFYAGYGNYYPKKEVDAILSECSQRMRGKLWSEQVSYQDGKSCQLAFTDLIRDYRKKISVISRDSTGSMRQLGKIL